MSTNENQEHWSYLGIDAWLDTLDPKKLTFKKMVLVTKHCLSIMSLNDVICHLIKKRIFCFNFSLKDETKYNKF